MEKQSSARKRRASALCSQQHHPRDDPSHHNPTMNHIQRIQSPFPGLWPDGKLRCIDSATTRKTGVEIRGILDILVDLNITGLYTAFFHFHAHVGELEIIIFQGRWSIFKSPVWQVQIDCREYPLININTGQAFYVPAFLEMLILWVQ